MARKSRKPVGWRGDPHEHNMARLGIETRNRDYVFRADGVGGPVNSGNLVDYIISYETGELDDRGMLDLFSYLVRTGQAWQLQGSYGRSASRLVKQGLLDSDGNILVSADELGASGLPKDVLPQFHAMYEDEIEDAKHYKQMAEEFPEYDWVFEKMASDEKRHAALVKRMEQGEDIDIRRILKDDVGDVLGAVEKAGRVTPINRKKLQKAADHAIEGMEVKKLKASGLEMVLVSALLGSMGREFGSRMLSQDSAAKK